LDQEACRRFRDKDIFLVLDPYVKTVEYSTSTSSGSSTGDDDGDEKEKVSYRWWRWWEVKG